MNKFKLPVNQTFLHSLAVVGFVALVGAGMWLAAYSTRFVPGVVNGVGAAAVYLGSFFTSAPEPSVSVIPTPTASSTISFPKATTTPISTQSGGKPTAGIGTSNVYQVGGGTVPGPLFGLPDLIVNINTIGYLETASADSFVASSTVPTGGRPAVRFTVKNVGTNTANPWRFSASVPSRTVFIFQSQLQPPLKPGESVDYTLGFDQSNRGVNQTVSITANYDHAIGESSENNNSASTKITVL